ncbi:hypothetical protein FEM03_03945 [Phragmitibacter flavus]|uniref:Uncharacterized protein n=1 Tax=Phragmitibacter flavus TaxID=2576071 RepID=A0A5R8KHZ5_9BACT|nr:hypothetical protein [Phragmitibacter flavus]TLD71887.1 hypothetical protein FEM03_03945 [Phragmitibacter flavus]
MRGLTPFTELPPIFRSWDLLASWDSTGFDSDAFWCVYLIHAYQPTPSKSDDPNGAGLREGATAPSGWSIVFLESIREFVKLRIENSPEAYQERLDAIAAHELGHGLGRVPGHPESTGLMKEKPDNDHDFSSETILRFRKQPRWP